MESNESYRTNIINRLKACYASMVNEMHTEYQLSRKVSTDRVYHQSRGDAACKLSIDFVLRFEQELEGVSGNDPSSWAVHHGRTECEA